MLARLLCLLALFTSVVTAQPPAERYEYRQEHDPNGTGKFYLGREIAHVMGHQAAGWLERPEREQEEQTEKMVAALKLQPGQTAADIGTGTGYIAERLARAVGPTGMVYAEDIQPEMLRLLERKLKLKSITNVKPVRGTESDPALPAGAVDLIILVDVYHELAYPFEMTQAMVRALKPGGRLVLVEFRAEDPQVPIKAVHKLSEAQAKKEMAVFPELRWSETIGTLPWQHILIFQKQETNP